MIQEGMAVLGLVARFFLWLRRLPACYIHGADGMKFRITDMTHSGQKLSFFPAGLNRAHKANAWSFLFDQKDDPRVGRVIGALRDGPVVSDIFDGVMFRRGVLGMGRHALVFTPWSVFMNDLKQGVIPTGHGHNRTSTGEWCVEFGRFSVGQAMCRARKIIECGRFVYIEFNPSVGITDIGSVDPPAKLTVTNNKGNDRVELPGRYVVKQYSGSTSGHGFALFYRWEPPNR